ncbi:MAG TPA: tetratricopeptide repeat protein, partial [Anaerolineae bacterium]
AQAHNLMAELKYRQARFDEAQALTRKVIREWSDSISSDEVARAYHWSGMAAIPVLDYELALTNLRKAEEICLTTGNDKRLARVLEGIAFVYYMQRDLKPALVAMQQSVQLSRDFSTPVNIASALNNIALVQFTLGQPEAALATFDEAISLVRDTSRNFLAQVLGNKAEVLAYLGRFSEALASFEEARELFIAMDDESGMIEVNLLWGYEYSSLLNNWDDARERFEEAQRLIELRPDDYPEEKARLMIGLGLLDLRSGSVEKATDILHRAEEMIEERSLAWWRPVVGYLRGLACLMQNRISDAKQCFESALAAVDQEGCPDYRPLILLELAQLELDPSKKLAYLEACVQTAQERARYVDRIKCLKEAGNLLIDCDEPHLRELGTICLAKLEELEAL